MVTIINFVHFSIKIPKKYYHKVVIFYAILTPPLTEATFANFANSFLGLQ